ncbi:YlbF family regulator [Desmospora activa]|uniref:Cell fate (Sporulation/competence/biofilm development) regulator YlbF (YheA/YmcA/DUF963 family) n=1 Tax=Desmospora activa DSM 45169 TaxID=1121389 RepID=A0A2T4Z851_9BACL|nr:YlbF family regulator [Desmospora activa]PTM58054.1 cell fate (sporulation/competence/biofilm development) regulator YlbF (YheA/YmcA/DUF963 family) [Desmospora activa DSM 45169]
MDPMTKARELADALRSSEEVQVWERAWRELAAETRLADDLLRYQEMRLQVETCRWRGEEPSAQLMQRWQTLKNRLERESSFRRFLEAEKGMARLTAQIQQILARAISPPMPSSRSRM